jgi:hypothetical protein
MSWQRADPNNDANASLDVQGMDFGCDQTMRVALVINGNISGQTYGTPELVDSNETLLEVATDGTWDGLGDGTKVWEGSIRVGGQGNATDSFSPDVTAKLGQNNILTLIAQAEGGSGEADTTLRMLENY